MKDRVAEAPGQYKATVTGEELQKMQRGEPFAIQIQRDDKPIEEGTPYSKAAVLPDELAGELCPGNEDPTPADALRALHARLVESKDHPGCYYRMVEGEKEWINPPKLCGVEYRTTERYGEKVVYTKRIEYQIAPRDIEVGVTIEIQTETDFAQLVRYFCCYDYGYPLPFISQTNGEIRYSCINTITDQVISIENYKSMWALNTWLQIDLYYTKELLDE